LRDDFDNAVNARKVVTDQKQKLQGDLDDLKKVHESDVIGNVFTALFRFQDMKFNYFVSLSIARGKAQEQIKNLEAQLNELQVAEREAEAAVDRIERTKKSLESDLHVSHTFGIILISLCNHFFLQDAQAKFDEESKQRQKMQKLLQKSEEELRLARNKIDEQNVTTSEQYVQIRKLQEENNDLRKELEAQGIS
jgi:DNA repair exonuclease SbcCD ATPase subunit